jgi:L-seryl-tRNA(Ser) seleniumtransferase
LLKQSEFETVAELCRDLPQLGRWLQSPDACELLAHFPRGPLVEAARTVLERLRGEVKNGLHTRETLTVAVARLPELVSENLKKKNRPTLRRVINAAGVLLQTNLGRAPLSKAALRNIQEVAGAYCNLEFDLDSGERGRRDVHAEDLILRLIGKTDRAATVVNNCAAATFLALNTLAEGGEVIVSRGELVEIGGGFRIPEILRKSGATLREVGTTNRTRVADYAAAITSETRLILRVHHSNFRMEGFTERPSLEELIALGAEAAVPVFEDQGTGCVVQLADFGIDAESNWLRSARSSAALVSASGDKLLGGPQCGILTGDPNLIARIRANPLARAFRVDKLTYAALQATLLAYLAGEEETIPVIAMLRADAESIRQRCERLAESLRARGFAADTVATSSVIGGGTAPGASLPSFAVALQHDAMTESELAAKLRQCDPPIIARTHQGRVLLDLRTVAPEDDAAIAKAVSALEKSP